MGGRDRKAGEREMLGLQEGARKIKGFEERYKSNRDVERGHRSQVCHEEGATAAGYRTQADGTEPA
jgi:hypothetical protein